MSLNFNNNSVSAVYIDGTAVDSIWFNNNQIYGSEEPEPEPELREYLYFEALAPNVEIGWFQVDSSSTATLEYSYDKNNWLTVPMNTTGTFATLTNTNDRVYIKATSNNTTLNTNSGYFKFSITGGNVSSGGNIMSLLDETLQSNSVPDYCFRYLFDTCGNLISSPLLPATNIGIAAYYHMFGSSGLTTMPILPASILAEQCYYEMFYLCSNLSNISALPATTLAAGCYRSMFRGCTSLTSTPQLAATVLADSCYQEMFQGCTSLTTVTSLPATTLAVYCYREMFRNCTSLINVPNLPATILTDSCYDQMFSGCTSLVNAPNLPATTLASDCYQQMFSSCHSLITAPSLPAINLANQCYQSMFSGCTSLVNAPVLPSITLTYECYRGMFSGCSSLTTAPQLPAKTLTNGCYRNMFSSCTSLVNPPIWQAELVSPESCREMFYGCTSLTSAPTMPFNALSSSCFREMFRGCTSLSQIEVNFHTWDTSATQNWVRDAGSGSGTFTCPTDLTITYGNNYIPTGWTVTQVSPVVVTEDGLTTATAYTFKVGTNRIKFYRPSYFSGDLSQNNGLMTTIINIDNPVFRGLGSSYRITDWHCINGAFGTSRDIDGRFTWWSDNYSQNDFDLGSSDGIVPSTLWDEIYPNLSYTASGASIGYLYSYQLYSSGSLSSIDPSNRSSLGKYAPFGHYYAEDSTPMVETEITIAAI